MPKIEIEQSTKSAAFMAAIKAVDDDNRAKLIARKESGTAPECGNMHCAAHANIDVPPIHSEAQIAALALEIGLSVMLNNVTSGARRPMGYDVFPHGLTE